MSNSSLLPLTFAVAAGLIFASQAGAQIQTKTSAYGSGSSDPFGGAPGVGTTGRPGKPASSDAGDNSDPDDPTLYRMKTNDSLASGAMSRDDGELSRKPRKREKVSKVESTKQLPTSGTDSKFQGSLLQSSVTSIHEVSGKANVNPEMKEEGGARFKARQLALGPSEDEPTKKKDSPQTKADVSPSPSASPAASAAPPRR